MTDLVTYAIFAMDAYDHVPDRSTQTGTAVGIWSDPFRAFFPSLINGTLGGYDVSRVSSQAQLDSNNFFAIAYTSGSETIISYRGTTAPWADTKNGYSVGAGYAGGPDATNAVKFYQDIAGPDSAAWQANPNITVVGHSLGGGLAGYVGAIYGLRGVLFDNMTFNNAASDAYKSSIATTTYDEFGNATVLPRNATLASQIYGTQAPYPNNFSHLSAYATTGELLSVLLFLRAYQTPPVQYLNSYGGSKASLSWASDLHSMALLTMLIYAQENSDTAWQSVGKSFVAALFNNSLGAAIVGSGGDSSLMQKIIAYSALSSGYMPFGDTGIQSLFADADLLGSLASNKQLAGILSGNSVTNALAEILVQYAGDLAASANEIPAAAAGSMSLNNNTLTINLNPHNWLASFKQTPAGATTPNIIGLGDLANAVFRNYMSSYTVTGQTKAWIASVANGNATFVKQLDQITLVEAALGGSGGDLSGANDPAGGAFLIGQLGTGSITGTAQGNDIIVGGATITTGSGNDTILTSKTTTINAGGGNNRIFADSGAMNVTLNYVGGAVGAPATGSGAGDSEGAAARRREQGHRPRYRRCRRR